MRFTVIGEIYCNADEARRMRARGRELEEMADYLEANVAQVSEAGIRAAMVRYADLRGMTAHQIA